MPVVFETDTTSSSPTLTDVAASPHTPGNPTSPSLAGGSASQPHHSLVLPLAQTEPLCEEPSEPPESPALLLHGNSNTWVESATFSPNESQLATCSVNKIYIWDVETRKKLAHLSHDDNVWKCVISRDGFFLYSVCSDGHLYVWCLVTFQTIRKIHVSKTCLYGCALHPQANILAVCSQEKYIQFYQLDKNGSESVSSQKKHTNTIEDVCFSPDGALVASASKDKTVRLWAFNPTKVKVHSKMKLKGHKGWVTSVCFSSDGHQLVSASADTCIKLWDVKGGSCMHTFRGHTNIVWRCLFVETPTDTVLLSISSDKTARMWSLTQRCEIQQKCFPMTEGANVSGALFWCAYAPHRQLVIIAASGAAAHCLQLVHTEAGLALEPSGSDLTQTTKGGKCQYLDTRCQSEQ